MQRSASLSLASFILASRHAATLVRGRIHNLIDQCLENYRATPSRRITALTPALGFVTAHRSSGKRGRASFPV
jgi:hypothetical protein